MNNKTNIELYYEWLVANPKKANSKVLSVYKKLSEEVKKERVVTYTNKETGEIESNTYIFDVKKAQRPIRFIEGYCKHSKGKWAGTNIELQLWQKAFIESLYGFVNKETKLRKYKKAILLVAKKNGKSTILSGLGLYGLMADGEGGSEVYSVAKIKDQAKLVWTEAKHMANNSPQLSKILRTTITGIYYDDKDAMFSPLASQTNSLDGKNPYYVLADEIWAWEDDYLLSIMEDGMSAREQPILFETSTMGNVRGKVFDNEYEYCEKVIKGYDNEDGGIVDETILPVIYELDNIEEWLDEECWYKANPNLTISKSLDYMRDKVNKAKNSPIALTNLLCKDFNVRQTNKQSWLTYEDLNNEECFTDFKDLYCIGGVDLSSTTDLTSASIIGVKNDKIYVKQMYWIPRANLEYKVKTDKIPYDKWEQLGLLRTCEGAKVDYHCITQWFMEEMTSNNLRCLWVGYDRWSAQYWADEMKEQGFDMSVVIQGAKTLSQPMKSLRGDLIDKKIIYNNNPILKWNLANVSIKSDINDNIQPIKEKSTQRIDGFMSLLDAYVIYQENKLEYEQYLERLKRL